MVYGLYSLELTNTNYCLPNTNDLLKMKFENILKDLRNKIYSPVYFLMGDEPYFIDKVSSYIEENVLSESEKEFNQTVLYGKETDFKTIISHAKRYPMMANHQVIVVREAQNMDRFEDQINQHIGYFTNPQKTTILVICYKYQKIDARKKISKTLEKSGVLFESKKLYDNKIPDWISDYIKKEGYSIEPVATQLLADYLGNNLSKIVNEAQKLFVSLKKDETITPAIIEENIGISKDYNVFEFQKALGEKNKIKAFRIVFYFISNPKDNPMVFILAMLYNYFSKLLIYHSLTDKSEKNAASALSINPFFVKEYKKAAGNYPAKSVIKIFSYLREYDLKSKGIGNVSADQGELMKELTYKILNRV